MEKLYLFSNTRAIKAFFEENYNASFLPNAQSMGEFFDGILRVEGKRKIPQFLRYAYLYQAIREVNPSKFGEFAKNFSQFLVNSDFFFKFYDELCAECVRIESLEKLDIYAFYDDHLQVLKEIFKSYQDKISQNHFFDKYFLEDYKITFELLSNFGEIEVHLEGFLSRFEMLVFEEISTQKPIVFKLFIDVFNQDYYQKMFKSVFEVGEYSLKLENKKIEISSFEAKNFKNNVQVFEFSNKISEMGGIFSQIDLWLERGIKPEEICIVLPNEDFKQYLELFDKARNFNFAMGRKIQETALFKTIKENTESLLNFDDFRKMLENLPEESKEHQEIKKVLLENLKHFTCGIQYLQAFSLKDQIEAFFMMLQGIKLDDIGGGRINTIGILETRGIRFSHIIIPEFNQGNVPQVSQKDIFLNTIIRKKVGLPTRKDRENLQKHYYSQLFNHSSEISIMSVNDNENSPSHFLLDTNIFPASTPKKDTQKYNEYFLEGKPLIYKEKEIIAPLILENLSPTKLECLLTCRRKYYYQYILKYKKETKEVNIGSKIHSALHKSYLNFKTHKDFQKLCQETYENLKEHESNQEFFNTELAKKYLQAFFKEEEKRLKEGWIPLELEKEFTFFLEDISFKGRIDRIDQKEDELQILDYKYKRNLKPPKDDTNTKDFQLPIYALAAKEIYKNTNLHLGYYDIYEAKIIPEQDWQKGVEILTDKIKELKATQKEFSYSLCEKRSPCLFCEFIYLCNRY